MERIITEIAKDMLHVQLNQDEASRTKLRVEVIACPSFFAVASESTTEEMWSSGTLLPYINEQKQLVLFLSDEEAIHFAMRNNILANGRPVVKKVLMDKVANMTAER